MGCFAPEAQEPLDFGYATTELALWLPEPPCCPLFAPRSLRGTGSYSLHALQLSMAFGCYAKSVGALQFITRQTTSG